jgi:hypothetical protein
VFYRSRQVLVMMKSGLLPPRAAARLLEQERSGR